MAKGATARRIDEVPTDQTWLPGFSGGPPSPPPSAPTAPAVSNARLGLLVFLGAEAMFFVGLIGAFLVFRLGSEVWPPPAQPRLPVGVTGINTVILLFSGLTGYLALRAVRDGNSRGLFQWILTTVGLGTLFLSIQGYEWIRLIHFGLTVSSGTYGTTIYINTRSGDSSCHGNGPGIDIDRGTMVVREDRKQRNRRVGTALALFMLFYIAAVIIFIVAY